VPPDFLNSREDALLVWAVVIVGYAIYKDSRGIGSALWNVIRAFCAPKLLLLFGSAALYSLGVVLLAARLDLWHTTALRETIYWFIGTGAVLAGNATQASPNADFLKRIIGRLLAVTIVIEFAVNLYVFPLVAEIVLVLVVLVFTGMRVLAQDDPKMDAPTKKVIDRVLMGVGVFLLISFAVGAVSDLEGFLSRETAERLLVAPALTIALMPCLYFIAWYSRREIENLRAKFGLR